MLTPPYNPTVLLLMLVFVRPLRRVDVQKVGVEQQCQFGREFLDVTEVHVGGFGVEAVGNMKLFNNHSGLRGLPCLAEGICWATGSSLTTPFTEGRLGVNDKASPPGRHQEQTPEQRCTFRPTTFSSVQCVYEVTRETSMRTRKTSRFCEVTHETSTCVLSHHLCST